MGQMTDGCVRLRDCARPLQLPDDVTLVDWRMVLEWLPNGVPGLGDQAPLRRPRPGSPRSGLDVGIWPRRHRPERSAGHGDDRPCRSPGGPRREPGYRHFVSGSGRSLTARSCRVAGGGYARPLSWRWQHAASLSFRKRSTTANERVTAPCPCEVEATAVVMPKRFVDGPAGG